MVKYKYEIGQLVIVPGGQLIYLGKTDKKYKRGFLSLWKCYCNKEFLSFDVSIGNNHTKSCGCWKHQIEKTEKQKNFYLYKIWSKIKQRCYNEKNTNFHNYGGRGIIIDPLWKDDSKKFIEDILNIIGPKPIGKYQLDRINNNSNYTINNLRWVTPKENGRNKRNNKLITIDNKTKTLAEWSEESNLSKGVILYRSKIFNNELILKPINSKNLENILSIFHRLKSIINRCYNSYSINYKNYGARGIKVYNLWKNNLKKFEEDIINEIGLPFSNKDQLDRINNNGNYEPGNIRWVTAKNNSRNKRNNHLITINNEEKTISEWSERSGIPINTINSRLKLKWLGEKLLTPVFKQKFDQNIIDEIRTKYNENIYITQLSKLYNTNHGTILDIICKRGAYSKL